MKLITLSIFFACCLGGCVNYAQNIADDLAVKCSYITSEKSMILQFGAPTSVQHVGTMTIYKYRWSAGMHHTQYSSYEVYKECEIVFENGEVINYKTWAQG